LYKDYLGKLLLTCFLFITIFVSMNYIVDPYGYNSRDNKFIKNISMFNKPHVTNARLNSDGYYYLIGTSRMSRVDPRVIEGITDKDTHNIKIDGATLKENILLAKEVKMLNKNFIFGFDAFLLNRNRLSHKEINNRYNVYKDELNQSTLLTKFFNSDITIRSVQHILKSIKGKDRNKRFTDENAQNPEQDYNFSFENVVSNSGVLSKNDVDKKSFSNYATYPNSEIIELAKIATEEDIFVIFPKHYFYYGVFSKYQDIEKKYFSAIKLLVENTKAKVWIFYGKNYITTNKHNFNDTGWHFKPKISDLIFSKIFNQGDSTHSFGTLLDKSKIDAQLNRISSISKE